jgi:hypothetical protein
MQHKLLSGTAMKSMGKALASSVLAIALTLAVSATGHAATVLTDIFSAVGSGTIDGTNFTNQSVVFQFSGGTVQGPYGTQLYDTPVKGSVLIGGNLGDSLSNYSVVVDTDPSHTGIGFEDNKSPNAGVFLLNQAFATYNFQGTFPLTTGTPEVDLNKDFTTARGDLIFTALDLSFEAVNISSTTPLPAALPLFATGLGALGLFGWRRKRKNAAVIAA